MTRGEGRPGEGRENPGRPGTAEEPRDSEPKGREEQGKAAGEDTSTDGRTDRPNVPRPYSEEAVTGIPGEGPWDTGEAFRAPGGGDMQTSHEAVPATSATPATAAPDTAGSSEPVLRILPLGSGLVLIGLGFALAFVAVRMRQPSGR